MKATAAAQGRIREKTGIKAGSQIHGDCVVSGKFFKDAWRIRS
ncbi:hypothetical protein SS05631_c02200 [Sinorhizobium sp. CCBAU 05631]|nr:hypothetical protein SS05631_c02200 [Sinorhizobium sp. CCBAU 05631]